MTPAATTSCTLCYAMELCFFLRVNLGIVVFFTTVVLSQNKFAGPSNGIPNIHNLYLSASIISVAILRATNSEPKVNVSSIFCRFENQIMGTLLRKIEIPVCE